MSSTLLENLAKNQKVLTRKEAAKYIGVALSTLDSKIHINYLKIGRSKRYLQSDLDAFLLSCRKGGSDE